MRNVCAILAAVLFMGTVVHRHGFGALQKRASEYSQRWAKPDPEARHVLLAPYVQSRSVFCSILASRWKSWPAGYARTTRDSFDKFHASENGPQ